MKSKWFNLKNKAIQMRQEGTSIRNIEAALGIPRSTLSGWLKDILLSKELKDTLHSNWLNGLITARQKAVKWHNNEKNKRLRIAEKEAGNVIKKIDLLSKETMVLALSMLYLGEGFKKKAATGMGNSDPLILQFFIHLMKKIFDINNNDFSCHLHLRADQDPRKMISFWSNALGIPEENFGKCSLDQRTVGSTTYDTYKGVCVVKCGNVAIQRKLVYLSRIYCQKIINSGD